MFVQYLLLIPVLCMVTGLRAGNAVYNRPLKDHSLFKKDVERKQQEVEALRKKEGGGRQAQAVKRKQEEVLAGLEREERARYETLELERLQEDQERERVSRGLKRRRLQQQEGRRPLRVASEVQQPIRELEPQGRKENARIEAAKKLIRDLREIFDGYIRRELVARRVAPRLIKEYVDDTIQDVLSSADTSADYINFAISAVNGKMEKISTLLPRKSLVNHAYAVDRYRQVERQ